MQRQMPEKMEIVAPGMPIDRTIPGRSARSRYAAKWDLRTTDPKVRHEGLISAKNGQSAIKILSGFPSAVDSKRPPEKFAVAQSGTR